jgi:hypothetical protein
VPKPRLNLTRFHGIFAPNFKHRYKIVPRRPRGKVDSDKPLVPTNWAQRLKWVAADGDGYGSRAAKEVPRASRLARTIDIERCPDYGGQLRVIACIQEAWLIRKILNHVNRGDSHSNKTARLGVNRPLSSRGVCP